MKKLDQLMQECGVGPVGSHFGQYTYTRADVEKLLEVFGMLCIDASRGEVLENFDAEYIVKELLK